MRPGSDGKHRRMRLMDALPRLRFIQGLFQGLSL